MKNSEKETILIVDDEQSVAETYKYYLDEKYNTRIATTGGGALAELTPSDSEVDLVVLDRHMPGLSGDAVAKHIDDYELEYRVIIVSAVYPGVDIAEIPCDGYLNKPVSQEEIQNTVEKVLYIKKYQDLVSEYNSIVEKLNILSGEFDDVEAPDELASIRNQKQKVELEIENVVEQLTETNINNALNHKIPKRSSQ